MNFDTVIKCPICSEEGEKSRLTAVGGRSTNLEWEKFFDEEGKYHQHDPNTVIHLFKCSNGHEIEVLSKTGCGACGKEDEVIIKAS
jgi:hypothetical protein